MGPYNLAFFCRMDEALAVVPEDGSESRIAFEPSSLPAILEVCCVFSVVAVVGCAQWMDGKLTQRSDSYLRLALSCLFMALAHTRSEEMDAEVNG